MSTNVTFNGTTYAIPAPGETGWGTAVTNFILDVGNNAGLSTIQRQTSRVATTTPVTVAAATDCVVATNLAVAGAVTVNLPAGVAGQWFAIVDQKGDAATNNITINRAGADTINGATSLVLASNFEAVVLVFSATNSRWNVIARYVGGSLLLNPMSSAGQTIYGGASGVPTALAAGTAEQWYLSGGAGAPAWSNTTSVPKAFTAKTTLGATSLGPAVEVLFDGASNSNYGIWVSAAANPYEADAANGGGCVIATLTNAGDSSGGDFFAGRNTAGTAFQARGDGYVFAKGGVQFSGAAGQSTLTFFRTATISGNASWVGSGSSTTPTYSGRVTRIGNAVYVSCTFTVPASGTHGDTLQVGNGIIDTWAAPAGERYQSCGDVNRNFVARANSLGNFFVYSRTATNISTGQIFTNNESVTVQLMWHV